MVPLALPDRHAVDDAPWQPQLTWWGHTWRTLVMLGISGLAWVGAAEGAWWRHPVALALDVALGVVAYVVVLWRRRAPLTVAVALTLVSAVSGFAGGPATLAAVSLATRRRYGQIALVGVLTLLAAQVWALLSPPASSDPVWLSVLVNVVIVVALLVFGMYVGSRRELLWTLRERAVRAETEQSLRVEQARANERARIAREMHDVLGHRISLVTMHAGALSYRDDLDRAQTRQSAQVILESAQLAMSELRSILGVLRGRDERDQPDRPLPTLADLPGLLAEAEASGTAVHLVDRLDPAADPPAGVARTAYRVVQEGLTNVRKHAPAAHATVTLSGAPGDGLVVRVSNPVPRWDRRTGEGGYGIVGLAERAGLSGGTLRSGVEAGEFVLEVVLPWPQEF